MTIQDKSLSFPDSKEFIVTRLPPNSFSGGAVVKNMPANSGDVRDTCSVPGLGRYPVVGHGNTPVFWLGESHELRSLSSHSP